MKEVTLILSLHILVQCDWCLEYPDTCWGPITQTWSKGTGRVQSALIWLMIGTSEHNSKPLGFIKCGEFLD